MIKLIIGCALNISLFLILISCAGYEGSNIKLNNFPEPKREELSKISISHTHDNLSSEKVSNKYGVNRYKDRKSSKCYFYSFTTVTNTLLSCPIFTNIPAILTATLIIPYYCAKVYESHATLYANQINPKTKKFEGKKLQSYELTEKMHEVWSLLWMLNPFSWDDRGPIEASYAVSDKISEAAVRQVLNDALNHKECYKNEKDYYEYQKQQEKTKKKGWWK